MIAAVLCSTWLSIFAAVALCDTPPEPPGDRTVRSLNNRYLLFSDFKQKRTTVFRLDGRGERTELWQMPGWFDGAALSNDGEHVVIVHAVGGLLDLSYKPDDVLLSFYRRGELINKVALNQLYADPRPENLERTTSHYAWSRMHGFDERGRYVVMTLDEREVIFDPDTGRPVNGELFAPRSTTPNPGGAAAPKTGATASVEHKSGACPLAFAYLALASVAGKARR